MADVVVFGTGDYAEQADYYLNHDSPHRVVAFALSQDFIRETTFLDRPVIPFETVETEFPADKNRLFLPMSSRKMNKNRESFFHQICSKGYSPISYVSSQCVNHAAYIGKNCFILERSNIQPFSRIGDNCVIWCGTHIGHHSIVEDHSFISGNVTVSGRCKVGANCHVSANSVVNAGVELGQGTLLGLSSVAIKNTAPWTVYAGNPARNRRMSSLSIKFPLSRRIKTPTAFQRSLLRKQFTRSRNILVMMLPCYLIAVMIPVGFFEIPRFQSTVEFGVPLKNVV